MKQYIPFIVAFALFMETLDSTIINTAIPKIALALMTDPISLKIALTSYLLSLAIFIPISGWLADRFGSKQIFLVGLSVFTIGSLCAGLAFNLQSLVLFRIIQGIGGALMLPVGRLILFKSFAKHELIKVTTYVTIPSLLGPALGPVLGGLIVTYISWRWIFFVNIPIGIIGIILAYKILPEELNNRRALEKLDFIGFILFSFGLAGFIFAFQFIGENLLSNSVLITMIIASLGLISLYFLRAHKFPEPFIDLKLFKIRTFSITILGSFFSRCGIAGIPFILPLFFQLGFSKTPLESGLLVLSWAIAMVLMKFFVRDMLKKFGFKNLLLINTFLLGLSMMNFALITAQTATWIIVTLIFINGLLTSMQFTCMNVLSYVDLREDNLSKGTSLGTALQQLSMSLGIALTAIILQYLAGERTHTFHIPIPVFHTTFLILGITTAVSAAIFLLLKKDDGVEASGYKTVDPSLRH